MARRFLRCFFQHRYILEDFFKGGKLIALLLCFAKQINYKKKQLSLLLITQSFYQKLKLVFPPAFCGSGESRRQKGKRTSWREGLS